MKKRLLASLLSATILLSMTPMAFADEEPVVGEPTTQAEENEAALNGSCGENATWKLEQNSENPTYTLTISGEGAIADYPNWTQEGVEDIRPWKDYLAVITKINVEEGITRIGDRAFHFINQIGSEQRPSPLGVTITLPETLKEIGAEACVRANITSIDIPESVTSMDVSAFYQCKNLVAITGLEGIESIGNYAFYGCEAMASDLTLPSATSIGARAFQGCTALTNVSMPNVTTIGDAAFYGCSALTGDLDLANVTEVGQSAFQATNIVSIDLPKTTNVPSNLVRDCKNLKSITLGANTTTLAKDAFSGCTALETVDFGGAHVTIGSYQFNEYTNLETVTGLDNAVVEEYAFNKCTALKSITFGENATVNSWALNACSGLETVDFAGADVTVVASMFETKYDDSGNCTRGYPVLKSVIGLKNAKTADGSAWNRAFTGCTMLETVDFDGANVALGSYIFTNCENLTTLSGLENVTALSGEGTIRKMDKLASFTVPASITSINTTYLFSECPELKVIDFTAVKDMSGVGFTGNTVFTKSCADAAIYVKDETDAHTLSAHTSNYPVIVTNGGAVDASKTGLAAVSNAGYEVTWTDKYDGKETELADPASASLANGHTYVAEWTMTDTISLASDATGSVYYGTQVTLTTSPANSNWRYVWYKDANENGTLELDQDTQISNNSSTLVLNNVSESGTYWVQINDGAQTKISNSVSVTIEKAAVTNTAKSGIEHTFGTTYDVSNLFDIDVNAGQATYTLVENTAEGAGVATLEGSILTITKAGNIDIELTTDETENYQAGEAVAATLYVNKAQPTITLTATPNTLTGSGTVTLTVTGAPEKVVPTCEGVTVTENEDGTFSATLPNESKTYTFVADYAGDDNHEAAKATCDVTVTYQSTSHGGGGSSRNNSYAVSTPEADNGTVTVNNGASAKKGDTVTITVKPDSGYEIDKVTVTDSKGNSIAVADKGDGKFSFTMPDSKVDVKATFVKTEPEQPSKTTFVDVPENSWYADAADFVAQRGLMSGVGENLFGGEQNTTRAMLMTILAKLDGQDVTGGATWYEKAMTWAKTNGVSDGTMPEKNITREQLATMLYGYAKLKGIDTTQGGMAVREFNDYDSISAWANQSMAWAVNAGILSGRGNNTLAPTAGATRAEMAVMLQQFVGLMEK